MGLFDGLALSVFKKAQSRISFYQMTAPFRTQKDFLSRFFEGCYFSSAEPGFAVKFDYRTNQIRLFQLITIPEKKGFDVLVVGAGPSGARAALRAAELGARVGLIDRVRIGGTCTNTGCVPTRVLAVTARLLRDIRSAGLYGIEVSDPKLLWSRTLARVQEVVQEVLAKKQTEERILASGGHVFFEGSARFISQKVLQLADTKRELHAEKIILCVGGKARRPNIDGVEFGIVPEELFSLQQMPKSIAIIGSGYTGVQVCTIMNAFGSQVTLLDVAPVIVPSADEMVSTVLRDRFEALGVVVVTEIEAVERIEMTENGMRRLHFRKAGEHRVIEVEAVLLCLGWPAALEDIGTEAIGLETERGFLKVNRFMQTNLEHIFAAGDVHGRDMLVQGAHFEAMVAAENAVLGASLEHRSELLPSGGFTDPDHAGVGLTERAASLEKLDFTSASISYANLDRAIIDGRKHGFVKLIADRQTGRLLGAHAIGENALELIQGLAISMSAGVTLGILASTRLSYPTYSSIVGELARRMLAQNSAPTNEGLLR